MTRRVLKGDPFPRINPLVDLYNSVSLKYLVPMGGHDLDTLQGDLSLQFAEGGEPFTPMGGGETVLVPKGELVYRDEQEVLTRNWVWRQCEKDKATEKTTSIFICFSWQADRTPLFLSMEASVRRIKIGNI